MTDPFPYQIKGARRIHRLGGRVLLADQMGMGKSLTALLYGVRHPELRPMIVVCPASLKWNWEREAATHFGIRAEVLSGTKPKPLGPAQLYVINYDILGPWLPTLLKKSPQLLIVDEAHYCASRGTLRTKHVRQMARKVPKVLALTGTPLTNRPAELWPVLNFLRPDLYPSFYSFAHKHCNPRKAPWGWEFKGASKLEELHSNLTEELMIRRRKEDVLNELPPKTRQVVPLEIERPGEYQRALTEFLTWLKDKDPQRARRAAMAEALTKVGYLKRLAAELKTPAALEWCQDWLEASGEKLVLFACHRKALEAARVELRKYRPVTIEGGTPQHLRKAAVEEFQRNEKCRVFLGNVRAAGVGITLTAASNMAFLELGWTPGEHTQAEDRIHRISQRSNVTCYYLVGRGTIEEHLAKILQRKQDVLNRTVDGGGGGDPLNVFDQLAEVLQRKEK